MRLDRKFLLQLAATIPANRFIILKETLRCGTLYDNFTSLSAKFTNGKFPINYSAGENPAVQIGCITFYDVDSDLDYSSQTAVLLEATAVLFRYGLAKL